MTLALTVGGVVVAAGSGERLGSDLPKALIAVDGVPLVTRAVAGLRAAGVWPIVVACPASAMADFAAALPEESGLQLVVGGDTRTDSVRRAVAALPDVDLIAVHDAARGTQPVSVIVAAVAALQAGIGDGVLATAPATAVVDTLKSIQSADGAGPAQVERVTGTIDRAVLRAVQTPQCVRAMLLREELGRGDDGAITDDLSLVERARDAGRVVGHIALVAGSPLGGKITYPADLVVAEALLREEGPS